MAIREKIYALVLSFLGAAHSTKPGGVVQSKTDPGARPGVKHWRMRPTMIKDGCKKAWEQRCVQTTEVAASSPLPGASGGKLHGRLASEQGLR